MNTTPKDTGPPQVRGRRLLLIVALVVGLALNLAPVGVALAAGNNSLTGPATTITPPTPQVTNDTTTTTGATRDAGEIGGGPAGAPCNFPLLPTDNTHSVWYRYAPASNGWLTIDTFGSNYDTVLEVFTGPASPTFATLSSIACNDDSA